MMSYGDLIERKRTRLRVSRAGIKIPPGDLHPALYPFQREIVSVALERGGCALFEDCGMGKTIQELEWARHVEAETGSPVLIFAPLAVGPQMVKEGERIGLPVTLARRHADISGPVAVTNYEMIQHFDPSALGGVVLDESSILKNVAAKRRTEVIKFAEPLRFRLAATATPAPNDLPELLNHAAFLGRITVKEALALWFTQDDQVQHWRLKGHAEADFWQWCASWAIVARKPGDIGFDMPGFDLPPLETIDHVIPASDIFDSGDMFPVAAGIQDVRRIRRASLPDRVALCADIVSASSEQWLVWCELNDESEALARAIPGAVEVRGSDSMDAKTASLMAFTEGRIRVLVTKASIAGHGMNWQQCARMIFVGAGYSYELYYQAVRRCWRYGQERAVHVHRISTEADRIVTEIVDRKEKVAMSLYDNIPWQMSRDSVESTESIETDVARGDGWTVHLGDSVESIDEITSSSVGLSVFSPPFPGMYVYTDSPHDMGNVESIGEMMGQFSHLMAPDKMMRVMMPGRSVFIHITQGVAQLGRDGYIGLKDFRGDIIRMMEGHGWRYYGEVTIDKNPQVKAIRTKDAGLMFKSLSNDASRMHPALADTLLQFRNPGENPHPIKAGQSEKYGNMAGWVTQEDWILWARPVWYASDYRPAGCDQISGIRETNVLNVSAARSEEDERHMCPLQLDVIERCVRVWSAPGETVYSPFAGVGSEGVVALQAGRGFIGGELKREYFETACRNLKRATAQFELFAAAS